MPFDSGESLLLIFKSHILRNYWAVEFAGPDLNEVYTYADYYKWNNAKEMKNKYEVYEGAGVKKLCSKPAKPGISHSYFIQR